MTVHSGLEHRETALEPALPIIDPHHHLWPRPVISYGPQQLYLIDALLADTTAGHDIRATVHVECSSGYRTTGPQVLRPVGETAWVIGQRRPGRGELAGIVGYADLRLGDRIGAVLDAHQEIAGHAFRGIRTRATWNPSHDVSSAAEDGLLLSSAAGPSLRQLQRRGLLFEVWVYFNQLDDVARVAEDNPDLPIVVDHLGSPLATGAAYRGQRDGVLARWRRSLRRLAGLGNVHLKIGGIGIPSVVDPRLTQAPVTSAALADFWGPEIGFCIDAFGPARCMFESNFPVDAYLCDYVTLWNTYKRVSADLSAFERDALFRTTALTVYGLDLPTSHPEVPA
ncbi:amidohydrolase family protein [Actinomadura rugatobispora]|uniref:Amidohydrolase family protein n=1 Tax=Actinomadura rugatobispora TaxID=1994 RepID=A0ABW1A8A1_9ACTN|nr:amidohydrolase family protein [Actinomadura rugatobispora]